MPRKVGNFEILGRMASENMDIAMFPDVANMNYSQKSKATKVEFGCPGNIIGGIFSGDKKAIMLMWDMKQFRELKAKMEAEDASL
jgi:hypothetical protein